MNIKRNQFLDLGNCILGMNRASKNKSANITFIIPDEVSEKFIKAFVVKNIELIASVTTSMLYSNEQIQIFSSGKLF